MLHLRPRHHRQRGPALESASGQKLSKLFAQWLGK